MGSTHASLPLKSRVFHHLLQDPQGESDQLFKQPTLAADHRARLSAWERTSAPHASKPCSHTLPERAQFTLAKLKAPITP